MAVSLSSSSLLLGILMEDELCYISTFQKCGLSKSIRESADLTETVAISKKHFQILQYNSRSLDEKMEYLIKGMDREIGELLSFPAFLGYNLNNRIKLRYELKKKVVGEEMSSNKLLSVSSKTFSKANKQVPLVGCNLDEEDTDEIE